MAEWSKAHAWKVCIGAKTSIEGSNPSSSAKLPRIFSWEFFYARKTNIDKRSEDFLIKKIDFLKSS
jgi:hypothetical protein